MGTFREGCQQAVLGADYDRCLDLLADGRIPHDDPDPAVRELAARMDADGELCAISARFNWYEAARVYVRAIHGDRDIYARP